MRSVATSDGTLASITDTQGRVTTAAYNGNGRLATITDPTGSTAGSYSHDASGYRLTGITERVGSSDVTHVFTRTAVGISRTVDNGAATTYAHDVDGKLAGLVDTAGKHHNAVTDYQGSVIALIDDTGAVTGTRPTGSTPASADQPARRTTPTPTEKATRSTTATRPDLDVLPKKSENTMARDNSAKPALPPGTLFVVLLFLAGAVVGAVMAVRHSSTENLILGIVLFICCAIFGLAGLVAWFRARTQS